ncbi:hypothetical protein KAR91_55220 [Candidatus Pacearchaeota archaeon]|nr:hypothetical protein [Candidatus Pacearchaeota archaeon]
MSDQTSLHMDRVKELETFSPVAEGDMYGSDSGTWVKLSDVQAMWIAFIKDLGDAIIGIGTDVKIEALDSEKALQDD